jgi:hypothetical protein
MTNANDLIHSFQHSENTEGNFKGLTKREHFSAMAMQGILNSIPLKLQDMEALLKYYAEQYPGMSMFECIAAEAVGQADALIAALNK